MKNRLLSRTTHQKGFTLVELLVVIVVIAILASIAVVSYRGIQNRAHDTVVTNDIARFYKHIKVQEVIRNSDFLVEDWRGNTGMHDRRYLNSGEEQELTQWLGGAPGVDSYEGDGVVAIVISRSRDDITGGRQPEIVARSKSGKVFTHDGSLSTEEASYGLDSWCGVLIYDIAAKKWAYDNSSCVY